MPHVELQVAVYASFELEVVVTAPGKETEQAGAAFFLHGFPAQFQEEAGEAFLRGFNACGGGEGDGAAGGYGLAVQVVFSGPGASEGEEVVVLRAEGEGGAGGLQQGDGVFQGVVQGGLEGVGVLLRGGG